MSVVLLLMLLGFLALFGLIVAAIAVAVTRNLRAKASDANAPRLRAEATVVDKRSEITGGGENRAVQHYYVTFQFPDGNRMELRLAGPESGMLTPGDAGTLEWQGSRYVGFARQILR